MDVLHSRATAAVIAAGATFALVVLTFYGAKVWAYQHPDNTAAKGLLQIIG